MILDSSQHAFCCTINSEKGKDIICVVIMSNDNEKHNKI